MNFKDMDINDIINWCKENNQVAWLKETASKQVEYKVYPKVKVAKVDANGNAVLSKKGKPMYTTTVDKTATPVIEMRPISFIQIKMAFVEKFMPEIAPKKSKKKTMYDLIAEL